MAIGMTRAIVGNKAGERGIFGSAAFTVEVIHGRCCCVDFLAEQGCYISDIFYV